MAFDHSSDSRIGPGPVKSACRKLTGLSQHCGRMTGKPECMVRRFVASEK